MLVYGSSWWKSGVDYMLKLFQNTVEELCIVVVEPVCGFVRLWVSRLVTHIAQKTYPQLVRVIRPSPTELTHNKFIKSTDISSDLATLSTRLTITTKLNNIHKYKTVNVGLGE